MGVILCQITGNAAVCSIACSNLQQRGHQSTTLISLFWWVSIKKGQQCGTFSHLITMTSSNGNIFRVTGHLCWEFTGHRWIPRTKASDAELWCILDLRSNKRLSKQWCGWWFETPSRPLWRHCNVISGYFCKVVPDFPGADYVSNVIK